MPERARDQAVRKAELAAKKAESVGWLMAVLEVDRAQIPLAFASDIRRRKNDGEEDGEEDIDVELDDRFKLQCVSSSSGYWLRFPC